VNFSLSIELLSRSRIILLIGLGLLKIMGIDKVELKFEKMEIF
jgi:hypothetical protein